YYIPEPGAQGADGSEHLLQPHRYAPRRTRTPTRGNSRSSTCMCGAILPREKW
ncbi:hypothetical protein SARC_15044, partial [Sphaeroforma arctica JP610]